jgi:hypothetical protein
LCVTTRAAGRWAVPTLRIVALARVVEEFTGSPRAATRKRVPGRHTEHAGYIQRHTGHCRSTFDRCPERETGRPHLLIPLSPHVPVPSSPCPLIPWDRNEGGATHVAWRHAAGPLAGAAMPRRHRAGSARCTSARPASDSPSPGAAKHLNLPGGPKVHWGKPCEALRINVVRERPPAIPGRVSARSASASPESMDGHLSMHETSDKRCAF